MGFAIVMRHGYRYWDVDSPLKTYDNKKLDTCCPEINKSFDEIQDYKIKEIICSPYLRTRQTAIVLQYLYRKYKGVEIPIYVDTDIAEYVPSIMCMFKKPRRNDFDEITLKYYGKELPPYCKESKKKFESRMNEFYDSLKSGTLVVTHQAPMKYLCNINGLKKGVKLGMAKYNILTI